MSNKNKTEKVAYNELAIRYNLSQVEYVRTSMAALSGCTAGRIYNSEMEYMYTCFMFYRPIRTDWFIWSYLLHICCYESLVDGTLQSRFQYMEKLFYFEERITDKWIFWTFIHIYSMLDLHIWNGSCLLN